MRTIPAVEGDKLAPSETDLTDVAQSVPALARMRAAGADWAGPAGGSAMAADDAVWPRMPCSEVVRTALLATHDHLDLVRLVLLRSEPPPPEATYSALRGALVGGCLALWVVECEDQALRRARALALVAENYRYRLAFHQSQTQSQDSRRAAHSRPWAAHWERRRQELESVRAGYPTASSAVTGIIEWVAREVFSPTSDAYATLMGLWQSSSASAHALGWGAFVRPGLTAVAEDPARGLSGFEAKVDRDDAADRYMTCFALLTLADQGLTRRCSA